MIPFIGIGITPEIIGRLKSMLELNNNLIQERKALSGRNKVSASGTDHRVTAFRTQLSGKKEALQFRPIS
jgi:hypothetical protein